MDCLAASPTNTNEVKMDVQRGYGAKDTYGPFPSANYPISVAAVGNQLLSYYKIVQCLDSSHTYFLFYFEYTNGLFAVQH